MIQLFERRMIEVTPDLADHYLKYNTYEAQRSIDQRHVEELAARMKDGAFRFGQIAFAMQKNGSKEVLMNGQHCLYAVITSKQTVPMVLEKFKAEDKFDMADLFKRFEIKPRFQGDFNNAERIAIGLDWPKWTTNLIVSAATIELVGVPSYTTGGGYQSTKEDRSKLLRKYIKEGGFVCGILAPKNTENEPSDSKHLRRAAVVYVMFQTYRKHQGDSKRFWLKVRDGEMLTKDMPEQKLRDFLIAARVVKFQRASNHEYIYRCILAWNSFRTGASTRLSYRPDKPPPAIK